MSLFVAVTHLLKALYHSLPMLATVVAAVRSVIAYLITLAYIAVVGPIGLVVGLVLRWKRGLYALGHAGTWLALRTTGIRYRVVGRDLIPDGAVVFCANHESNVDPPVLFEALHPRLHFLYKAELHKFPLMGTLFDIGGFVPIERGDRDSAIASINRGAEALRAGNSFLIFPEGTRSRTGQLLPFKKGGFIMALQAQVPIVPVAIHGGRASMRKGSPIVRPVLVTVRIGNPVHTRGLTISDRDRVVREVREEIERLLACETAPLA